MERLMTALLELTLPMALVIAVLLAAGPLLGRRFTAKWRYWAWLLIAVRLLLPVGITLPQPVVTLPQPQGEFTYPVSREEPAPTEPAQVGDPIQVVPGAAENDPYQQIKTGTTAPTGPSTETPKPAEPAITPTPAGTRFHPGDGSGGLVLGDRGRTVPAVAAGQLPGAESKALPQPPPPDR